MENEDIVTVCYEWQINNLKFKIWAKKLKEKIDKIGLAYYK
jgi:hypothetical protein